MSVRMISPLPEKAFFDLLFNNLNITIDSDVLKGLKLDELLKHLAETTKENGSGVIKDDNLVQQLHIALGGMALVVASSVHPRSKKHDFDGLVKIGYTKFLVNLEQN